MSAFPPFSPRPLDPFDLVEATALAHEVGVHGLYVSNSLGEPEDLEGDEILGLYGSDSLLGIAWFGRRGNLIIIERKPLDPMRVVPAITAADQPWRIALGSPQILHALEAIENRPVLCHRSQTYYGMREADLSRLHADEANQPRVRQAERRDVRPLIEAALDLNEQDLNVDRWRVNRSWLKDSVKRRIKDGRTYVLGPLGQPWCKLDLGSRGAAGVMIEGVYTLPEHRGKGLATHLVAIVTGELLAQYPFVCLHVDAANTPARRAYERAGMTAMGSCQLLLRS